MRQEEAIASSCSGGHQNKCVAFVIGDYFFMNMNMKLLSSSVIRSFFSPKCSKYRSVPGSARTRWEDDSAPPDYLAGLRGPTSKESE